MPTWMYEGKTANGQMKKGRLFVTVASDVGERPVSLRPVWPEQSAFQVGSVQMGDHEVAEGYRYGRRDDQAD